MLPKISSGLVVLFLLFLAFLLAGDSPVAGDTGFAEPITDPPNHPPVANCSIREDPDDLWTNMTLHFSSAGSYDVDGEGRISFSWDFGDGSNISTLANPVHVYRIHGIYTVVLTVIDQHSVIDMDTLDFSVRNNYGDTEIIIIAVDELFTQKTFRDPGPDMNGKVAVKRGGWVAYLCKLRAGQEIIVTITVLGERPVDIYLFREADFLTYKNEPLVDQLPSEVKGFRQNVTDEFMYRFRAPEKGRYYVVIDNKDRPLGTDTEWPVDYTISIDNRPPERGDPDPPWERTCLIGCLLGFITFFALLFYSIRKQL